MDDQLTVRAAEPTDAAAIRAVNRVSWLEGYKDILSAAELDRLQDDDTGYTPQDYRDGITTSDTLCLVVVDDRIIGYCSITPGTGRGYVEPDERHLQALYVHPDHWRRGAGRALLTAAVDRLDAAALKTEVLQENDRGIAFYEAQGFEQVAEHSIGPDTVATLLDTYPTVVMARQL